MPAGCVIFSVSFSKSRTPRSLVADPPGAGKSSESDAALFLASEAPADEDKDEDGGDDNHDGTSVEVVYGRQVRSATQRGDDDNDDDDL